MLVKIGSRIIACSLLWQAGDYARTTLALETESGFHSLRIRVESGLHQLAAIAIDNSRAHTAVLG
jgi:hypothetical protein